MPTKRYITVPENRTADRKTPWIDEGAEMSFKKHVINPLLEDGRWGQSRRAGRGSMRIEDAFENASPGDVVELFEDDWKILKEAAEEPTHGYRPGMLRFLERWGWLDAVTEAPTKDPRTAGEEEEDSA